MIRKWGHWVAEMQTFLDAEGTFRHWKYGNDYSKQPAVDVAIYKCARARWVELKNEELKRLGQRASVGRNRRH